MTALPVPPPKPPAPSQNGFFDEMTKVNLQTAFGAGLSAIGAYREYQAEAKAAQFRSLIAQQNEESFRLAAADALRLGEISFDEINIRTAQRIGQQRAALAANGIVLDQDTALDLVTQTAGIGTLEALTALDNAEREAADLIRRANVAAIEGQMERAAAKEFKSAGRSAAFRNILTGFRTIQSRMEGA